MKRRVFNSLRKLKLKQGILENKVTYGRGAITVRCKNESEDDEVEVMIYDSIGADPWSDGGFTAKDLREALKGVPKNKTLNVRVNSPGGDVMEGEAIKVVFDTWQGKVIVNIDGIAASTASWMILGADEIRAPKLSQMFIHDALTVIFGNEADCLSAANDLGKLSDQIACAYADKAGGSVKSWRDLMRKETLLTGEEAKDLGLVDVITDAEPVYNFTAENLTKMRERLGRMKNSATPQGAVPKNEPKENKIIMNKEKMIALLNKWGVKIPDGATDAQLENLVEAGKPIPAPVTPPAPTNAAPIATDGATIINLQKQIDDLNKTNDESRRTRVSNRVDKIIADDKIPAAQKDKAINRAMKDETYLDELEALPSRPPGAPSLMSPMVDITDESFASVQKFVLDNTTKVMSNFIGAKAQNEMDLKAREDIGSRAKAAANILRKHKNKITAAWNTNNIDAQLQRQVLLNDMLEDFAVVLMPLTNFSTVFDNVPREGTDLLEVPYYPLQAAASVDFVAGNGYRAADQVDTNVQHREIAIGGDGVTAAAANTARFRKWIGFAFSSYQLRSQPYVSWQKLAQQNANKLGVDVFKAIIQGVITRANFGQPVKAMAPQLFQGDDIADLSEIGTGLYWPEVGRSLTLNHTYRTPLLKDPTFKQYLSYGNTDPLHKARIQEAYGFEDINIVPNLTNYSPAAEALIGWIAWRYAVLCAFAPIMPTEEVRALMTRYDLAVDPQTGISLAYRRFGDTVLDQTREVVESTGGAAKGVDNALRILSAN